MIATALIALALLAAAVPPPPGKLVDIGGRKLHLHCTGSGSPAVVLVAGGQAFAIDWALVQPALAATTRVCSYDRAGLGWSDAGPADETVEQTVGDLHTLLERAGERGPYVFVGASIGGIFIRAYQRAFPSDVAALVFSNSSNRVGLAVNGTAGLLWALSEDQIRSAFPLPPPPGPAPSHEGDPFDRLPADLQAVRLQFDVELYEKARRDPGRGASLLSWRQEFLREFDETEAGTPPLGSLPVIVISSELILPDGRSRDGLAARLPLLSTNTTFVVAKGSGHEIHLYQPATVGQALRQAVAALRNR
jgi:pimeloyl-ACP methyl ester carboxylesterase